MSVSVSFGGACRKTTTSTTTAAATTLFHFTVAHSHSGSHWLVQSLVPNDKQMALISALLSTEQQQQTMKNCPNCHNSFLLFHLFPPSPFSPFPQFITHTRTATLKHVGKTVANVELSDHLVEVVFTLFDDNGKGGSISNHFILLFFVIFQLELFCFSSSFFSLNSAGLSGFSRG